MGPQGLCLNQWTSDFDPAQDVPSAVLVWVRLPHMSLHCWSLKSLEAIGNALGKYIDKAERKDQYSCAHICMEMDLEIGLSQAINITVADWTQVQELYYEQLPFKWRHCHDYRHFARNCKKKAKEEEEKSKGEKWKKVQKQAPTRQHSKPRSKGTPIGSTAPSSE